MPSPVEREARRADVRKRAEHARAQLTTRGMEAVGAQVQENSLAIAELQEQAAARDEEITAIKAGLAAAFEFAGKEIPEGLGAPAQRPALKLIRGGAA